MRDTAAPADDAAALQARGRGALANGDPDGALVHLAAAVRRLTELGEVRRAALACAELGDLLQTVLANRVAARPWFRRAERLVADEEPCVEQGWVALAALGCDVDDPADLVVRAEMALDRARRFGDVDLEVKALADGGLGHVRSGQVRQGMAMLDEAMALACGGGTWDEEAVGKSVCSFYTACYDTADLARVESWSQLFARRGMLGSAPGPQAWLTSHCDSVRGILLCHLGRWGEAEDVLVRAHTAMEAAMPGASWHPPIALAELRIAQGRLAEAEALLLGRDDHLQALVPLARLHLARGDHDLAVATAARGLRLVADDRVRAAALLGVVVEARLRQGRRPEAVAASAELDVRTADLGLPALAAEAARLRARVAAAVGDHDAAATAVAEGLHALAGNDLPMAVLALHLEAARVAEAADDDATAVVETRAAAAALARLDVVVTTDDAALLARHGADAPAQPPTVGCRVATLRRDGSWWTADCGGTTARLRDTKGLVYLAELVAHAGVERHALDLVDRMEGVDPAAAGIDRRRLGDAGAALDGAARSAYRRRAAELRDAVEDALAAGDDDRAAATQAELDAVVAELGRALGLGGRDRRAASAAERARLNVTRALRSATARLAEALPDAGAVLDRRVRTGTYLAYEPHADDEVLWVFDAD